MKLLVGDALEKLKTLDAESVQTCVTSPPYWALRDYGVAGQVGLEPSPSEYIARMVEIFREIRRVLKRDGTLWVNMGDSYAQSRRGGNSPKITGRGKDASAGVVQPKLAGLKPKDLVGMPWRLAFALQDDGWWLRQDIVWHKPNPMPESVQDRCTKAHEYIFLLTKASHYYFNALAIQEPCSANTRARMARAKPEHAGSVRANGGTRADRPMTPVLAGVNPKAMKKPAGWNTYPGRHDQISAGRYKPQQNESFAAAVAGHVTHRNKRTVWTVGTTPYKQAHFATFPPKLIEPCILAGSPRGGLVLDPFAGTCTTGYVAAAHGREFVGIELNPEYAKLAKQRVPGLEVVE